MTKCLSNPATRMLYPVENMLVQKLLFNHNKQLRQSAMFVKLIAKYYIEKQN